MPTNKLQNNSERAIMALREAQIEYMQKEKLIILSAYTFPSKPSTDGYYHIAVKDASKKSGRKQLAAKSLDELKEKVYQHERGEYGLVRKRFKDVFEIVENGKLNMVKSQEKKLSVQNTILRDRSEYKRFFAGSGFENMYVEDITNRDIDNIIRANLQKYDLRDKGFSSLKAILRAVFNKSYYCGYCRENPFLKVDLSVYKNMLIDSVDVNQRCHTSETVEQMLQYLHEYQLKKPAYIPAYALEFQILTATRRGEIPPLMWSDVNNDSIHIWREQITVKATKTIPEHFVIVSHTKTHQDRYFPICNDLDEFLVRLTAIHDKYYPDSNYLFPAHNDNGVITNNTVYNFYRRMCQKLGVKISKDLIKGCHSFRRNAITDIINISGGDVVMASKLVGNSPAVAVKNYFTDIDSVNALNCLNQRKMCS